MKFTDQQWHALSRLLDEALALPAAERQAWLETLPPSVEDLGPTLSITARDECPLAASEFVLANVRGESSDALHRLRGGRGQ